MKNIKGMELLLSFGSILVFLAGLSLIVTSDVSILVQVISMSALAFFMLVYSLICKEVLKVNGTSKLTFLIGTLSLLVTYVVSGCNNLFGEWFSINGDGCQLFLASILFLMAILAILVSVKFKNYSFIHITFISIICALYHIFNFFQINYQISLIIIGGLMLFFNIFKVNKKLYDFTNVSIYIFALLSLFVGYHNSIIYGTILLAINFIGVVNLLYKFKKFDSELLTVIIYVLSTIVYFASYADNYNLSILVVVTTLVITIMDMLVSTLNVFDSKVCKFLFKAYTSLFSTIIILSIINTDSIACITASIFFIVSSFVSSYIFKKKSYEEFLFPIKVGVIIYILINTVLCLYVNEEPLWLFYAIYSLFILVFYRINIYKIQKIEAMVLSILSLVCLASLCSIAFELTACEYIGTGLIILLSYIVFNRKNLNSIVSGILVMFVIALYALLGLTIDVGLSYNVLSLINIAFALVMCILSINKKFNFIISSLVLLLYCDSLVASFFSTESLTLIISSTFALCLSFVDAYVLTDKDNEIDTIVTILSTLILINLLLSSSDFIVTIYSLVISLILIFINVVNKTYKSIGYVGLIFGIINVLTLLRYLDGLPTAFYTLSIGLTILIVVSIMVYRYQKISHCSKCGSKIKSDENFCGVCGNKLK